MPALLCRSSCSPFCEPCLDQVLDYTAVAFCECEFVCQAGLQQYAHTVMACQISCGCSDRILAHSEVCEMAQFRQYEKALGGRGLDLSYFLAKILPESFL